MSHVNGCQCEPCLDAASVRRLHNPAPPPAVPVVEDDRYIPWMPPRWNQPKRTWFQWVYDDPYVGPQNKRHRELLARAIEKGHRREENYDDIGVLHIRHTELTPSWRVVFSADPTRESLHVPGHGLIHRSRMAAQKAADVLNKEMGL